MDLIKNSEKPAMESRLVHLVLLKGKVPSANVKLQFQAARENLPHEQHAYILLIEVLTQTERRNSSNL